MNWTVPIPIYNPRPDNGQIVRRGHRPPLVALLTLFAFHFLSTGATAQTTTSTIEGTVRDAQAAVIAGAHVRVRAQSLGVERTAVTDGDGVYRVAALPAGIYSLTVSSTGFADRNFENIELTVNRTVTLDVQLEVGAIQGQVDVSAD